TTAMAAPQGGVIAGQASLMGLDGWTVEEMDIDPGAAMIINYPSLQARRRFGGFFFGAARPFGEVKKEYEAKVAELNRWMDGGRQYAAAVEAGQVEEPDLALAAMSRVVNREMPVLLEANGERDIRNAVDWAEKQNIRFILTGGEEAWKVADLLAEKDVPVILGPTQAMPSGPDEEYDEAYANPGKLHAAGVKIAFATFNSSDSRTLPYEAAMAVPYGLPHDAALEAVTRNAAEMLGVGDKLGTIERGKLANLIVTDGDPLEIETHVLDLFILGRKVSTDNRQKTLWEKYRARPKERIIS
ncbi:MAG: amidohydrolase family protein, partial [Gemmatimonadota bacterium]